MRTAIIVPIYNEALTIAKVVGDFADVAPGAEIVVVDNNSDDGGGEVARAALERCGAAGRVVRVERQGKANAMRWAFQHVEADLYVMVDGDDTYPAQALPQLLAPVESDEADVAVGDRLSVGDYAGATGRAFHGAGNLLVRRLVNALYGASLNDILSGYRVFSRRFVKTYPILCEGFELETEMTLHALDKRFRVREVPIPLRERPAGSASKLRTFSDGARVLRALFLIFKDYKPLLFFSCVAGVLAVLSLGLGAVPIYEFVKYAYVYRVPTAILASGAGILAVLTFGIGLVLDTVAKHNKAQFELLMLAYDERHGGEGAS